MARLPRIVIPEQPLHIIQRGNNRLPCFFADEDYRFYLDSLKEASTRYGCRVHAYVLMTNHVHLLLTPESVESPSAALQSVGRRYVRYINHTYRRSGTLWEGRFKSALIDSERYLLVCSRYIELNPVRARMVEQPGDYRWSSYRHNALGQADGLLTPHYLYESLNSDTARRCAAYRRSGTLWEGRFKSALIDSERYLLVCSRYIELNPVRARMVEQPGDYRWSSYRHNALGQAYGL